MDTVAQTAVSISICPNRRRAREFLVLVLVLVLGNGAIEDENEDEDDLVAAWPRCAVSPTASRRRRGGREGLVLHRRGGRLATCAAADWAVCAAAERVARCVGRPLFPPWILLAAR